MALFVLFVAIAVMKKFFFTPAPSTVPPDTAAFKRNDETGFVNKGLSKSNDYKH